MWKLNILAPSTLYSQKFDTLRYSEAMCTLGEKSFIRRLGMVINLGNKSKGYTYLFTFYEQSTFPHLPPFFSEVGFSAAQGRSCR